MAARATSLPCSTPAHAARSKAASPAPARSPFKHQAPHSPSPNSSYRRIHVMRKSLSRSALLGIVALNLAGCATMERLDHIGEAPTLTPVGGGVRTDRQVALPMPRTEPVVYQSNSLWAAGSRSFFKDQRATKVGDILTVLIAMNEKAELSNQTARSRKANETADMTNLLGLEQGLAGQVLPVGY